jgi:hypothetical protein
VGLRTGRDDAEQRKFLTLSGLELRLLLSFMSQSLAIQIVLFHTGRTLPFTVPYLIFLKMRIVLYRIIKAFTAKSVLKIQLIHGLSCV